MEKINKKITGKITSVASTMGLKLDGGQEYYNPIGNAKNPKYINKDLMGKMVEISLADVDKKTFTFLKVIEADSTNLDNVTEVTPEANINKTKEYWTQRDTYWMKKEERENENYYMELYSKCIAYSSNLFKIDLNSLPDEKIEKSIKTVLSVADEMYIEIINKKVAK